MVGYGWTMAQLHEACTYASDRLIKEGGVGIDLRYPEVRNYDCKLGGCVIKFTLGCDGPTKRRKDGTYPVGVAYTSQMGRKMLPKQPIPYAEVMNVRHMQPGTQGRDYVDVIQTRSTGSLCWHSFGHVMAKMFELNPAGKLRTGEATYDGRDDFQDKADDNKKADRQNCDCHLHNLGEFFTITE